MVNNEGIKAMNVQKEPAARLGQQAAGKNHSQRRTYRKAAPLSSLKSEIGELLFCLEFPIGQELTQVGWGLFERWLRQYVDLIHTGGIV